jgi:hypothetical protein
MGFAAKAATFTERGCREADMNGLAELKDLLNRLPIGAIPAGVRDQIFELVETCWDKFEGSDLTKMEAWKISRDDGPEDLTWDAPNLSFTIERHGGTVMGSRRAERQTWTLNLDIVTATAQESGYRQLQPNSPRLDVTPIASAVCEAVQRGPASRSDLIDRGIVEWRGNDEIRVKHASLIPNDGPKDTVSGRRKRLRQALKSEMKAIGWEEMSVSRWITFKRR